MTQVIIYKTDEGYVAIIHPIKEVMDVYGIDAIARKDVPSGKPYKIVNIADLPLDGTFNENGIPNIDKSFRAQWDIEDSELTDGVGSESNEFEDDSSDELFEMLDDAEVQNVD